MASYIGGTGDDTQAGTAGSDIFDYSQGGHDTLIGGGGGDTYIFGDQFDSLDQIVGTVGWVDTLVLNGDYSAGLTIGPDNLVSVDEIDIVGRANITLLDGAVASDSSMIIDIQSGRVDGSDLTGGRLVFFLQTANGPLRLIGGDGDDTFNVMQTMDRRFHFDGGAGTDDRVYFTLAQTVHTHDKSFVNVEGVYLTAGVSLTLRDANLAAGQTMLVQGVTTDNVSIDGHRETDGHFDMGGWDGDDGLTGGQLSDTISGGAGDDFIIGGRGADILTGGAGSDEFSFRSLHDSYHGHADLITDLDSSDVIDLSLIDADRNTGGLQSFTVVASFSGHAGELMISYDGSVTSFLGDVNGDGRADLVIEASGDHTDFNNLSLLP